MRHHSNAVLRRLAAFALIVSTPCWLSGCATLAHRSSYVYEGKKAVTACEHKTRVCPWLIGDGLLLLPGIVPGVIALVVDFGTGAWEHDHYVAPASPDREVTLARTQERRIRKASDSVENPVYSSRINNGRSINPTADLLFPPGLPNRSKPK